MGLTSLDHVLRHRQHARTYFANTKKKFLAMYGDACACCGETNETFLTIEHKQGQVGAKKKITGATAYRQALKAYRPDLYEVLCFNCNLGRRYTNGVCPHQLDN